MAMYASAVASAPAEMMPEGVDVPNNKDAPVKRISGAELRQLGQNLSSLFGAYKNDRRLFELRMLRNQRQYLGVYDPELEQELSVNRSRAYPRITRVKIVSILSRLMDLMFQGNERNWEVKAQPWPEMTMDEMQEAMEAAMQADQAAQVPTPNPPDVDYIMGAVQTYADRRAEQMSKLIDDQLQELGGSQKKDYVALNRAVIRSGLIYGVGVLRGPFARKSQSVIWNFDNPKMPVPRKIEVFKPMFEWLNLWDFYPDMSAKSIESMDGYFIRQIFSRSQIRELATRSDFMADQILEYLKTHEVGNYKAEYYEAELRAMGVKANVNEQKPETTKYEVLCWHGKVSGNYLTLAGVDVPEDKLADDMDAEIWLLDGNVIKAIINPWKELGVDMPMIHTFIFDEDDTSPLGFGVPNSMRDSQMAVAAATRMLMDNASVVCGPNIEVNTDLMRPDQDLRNITSYKVWYREGDGPEAQWPAVRNVQIDSHLDDLLKVIDLFMKFADAETFVGPATGGDMSHAPSEPMRTAAGASMLRGDAALPFKDMIRSFDSLTQSIIYAMVQFNRQFNPELAPMADYDVIARGATSLMAKELRGMQADQLVSTLTPEEKQEVDMRKLILARLKSRDMEDILVDMSESKRRSAQQAQTAAQTADQQNRMMEANIRKILSDGFKNIASGQMHVSSADATSVATAMDVLERGISNGVIQGGGVDPNQVLKPELSGVGPGANGPGGPAPASAGQA
jgi:hypothetical protein